MYFFGNQYNAMGEGRRGRSEVTFARMIRNTLSSLTKQHTKRVCCWRVGDSLGWVGPTNHVVLDSTNIHRTFIINIITRFVHFCVCVCAVESGASVYLVEPLGSLLRSLPWSQCLGDESVSCIPNNSALSSTQPSRRGMTTMAWKIREKTPSNLPHFN